MSIPKSSNITINLKSLHCLHLNVRNTLITAWNAATVTTVLYRRMSLICCRKKLPHSLHTLSTSRTMCFFSEAALGDHLLPIASSVLNTIPITVIIYVPSKTVVSKSLQRRNFIYHCTHVHGLTMLLIFYQLFSRKINVCKNIRQFLQHFYFLFKCFCAYCTYYWDNYCNFSSSYKVSQSTVIGCILNAAPKSYDLDPTSSILIKECIDSNMPSLTDLFYSSLTSGIFPQCFKTAFVTLVIK